MGGKSKVTRLGHGREFVQGLTCPRAMWTDKGQTEVSINQRAPVYWWLLHTSSRPICFLLKHSPDWCCFLTVFDPWLSKAAQSAFDDNEFQQKTHTQIHTKKQVWRMILVFDLNFGIWLVKWRENNDSSARFWQPAPTLINFDNKFVIEVESC